MIPLLKLEFAKLIARRSVLYLVLPNIYTICYVTALVVTALVGSANGLAFLGASVTSFIVFHPLVSISAYPVCMLMFVTDLWCTEQADRSLRTLLLMQVPRARLLAARVIVVTAVMLLAFLIYFGAFFGSTLLLHQLVAPEVWERIRFPVVGAFVNMSAYTVAFTVGLVTATLFFTLVALISTRPSTVGMFSMLVLVALVVGVPTVEEWLRPGSQMSNYLFTRLYHELVARDLVRSLMLEQGHWGSRLVRISGFLALNAAVLWAASLTVLRRKQITD